MSHALDGIRAIDLTTEIAEATGKTIGEEAPAVILAASPRYWELCRKREAQKGAGWIRELDRIGREISTQIGVEVFFYSVSLTGDEPGWNYEDDGPVLVEAPDFGMAWEMGAGKLKPKPKKSKKLPKNCRTSFDAPAFRSGRRARFGFLHRSRNSTTQLRFHPRR